MVGKTKVLAVVMALSDVGYNANQMTERRPSPWSRQ
jgi:hypothetical protein